MYPTVRPSDRSVGRTVEVNRPKFDRSGSSLVVSRDKLDHRSALVVRHVMLAEMTGWCFSKFLYVRNREALFYLPTPIFSNLTLENHFRPHTRQVTTFEIRGVLTVTTRV